MSAEADAARRGATEGARRGEVNPETAERVKRCAEEYGSVFTSVIEAVLNLVESLAGGGTTPPAAGAAHGPHGAHK